MENFFSFLYKNVLLHIHIHTCAHSHSYTTDQEKPIKTDFLPGALLIFYTLECGFQSISEKKTKHQNLRSLSF